MPHDMDKKRAVSPGRQPVFCRQTHRHTPRRLPTPQRTAEHARLPSLSALRSVLFACPPSRPYALTRWAPIPPHRPPVTPPRRNCGQYFCRPAPCRNDAPHGISCQQYRHTLPICWQLLAGVLCVLSPLPPALPPRPCTGRTIHHHPHARKRHVRIVPAALCPFLTVLGKKKHKRAAPQGSSPFVVI